MLLLLCGGNGNKVRSPRDTGKIKRYVGYNIDHSAQAAQTIITQKLDGKLDEVAPEIGEGEHIPPMPE